MAVILTAFAFSASAGGPLGVCSDGTPMKRAGGGFLTLNLDQGNLGTRTNAQMAVIAGNAMALWNNFGAGTNRWSTVNVTLGPDLPEDVTAANQARFIGNFGDGVNPVIYDTDGTIIDAVLGPGASDNNYGFWGSLGSPSPPCGFTESYMVINGKIALTDQVLTTVIGKFIGHFLGLDQTQLDSSQGLTTGNYPLMYPFAYRLAPGLQADDIAAISGLYPSANFDSNYGTLTGTFVTATGAPILGANIWAQNLNSGELFSSVSDYRGQRTGEFKLTLPIGTYVLHAEAIHQGFHIGQWANGAADVSFQPPLYSGDVPMTPVTMTPQVVMLPGCNATVTFAITGAGTRGATCTAPSEIFTPSTSVPLPGASAFFQWTVGVGTITERYLSVGTTPGGNEIYSGYQGTTSFGRNVVGLPIDGSRVYARLMSYMDGVWRTRDYTFTAATITGPLVSEMKSPVPPGPLMSDTTTFEWTTGNLVTSRSLTIGAGPGGSEYYGPTDLGSALSRTVTNLPTDGRTLWVRLTQVVNGQPYAADYIYTAALLPFPSNMTVPTPGTTLAGASVTFQWNPGYRVDERYLRVGSTVGGADIYAGYQGSGSSRTVNGIPTNGRTIYVSLMSYVNGMWQTRDYTYVAMNSLPAPSQITSPAPGSTLGTSATFQWSAGSGVTERYLSVGTAAGASDIYGGYQGTALSRAVTGIPANGSTIYVMLSSWLNGGWVAASYTYIASGSAPPTCLPDLDRSYIISPAEGSTLSGASVTFGWTAGCNVTERYLMVGTTAGGSEIYSGYQGSASSHTINSIPTDGHTIYVTLMSYVRGAWELSTATYMASAAGASGASEITSPTPGSGLLTSAVILQWTAGTGVTERYLMVGSSVGGSDVYEGYQGAALTRTVSGLKYPAVYVRLMSYVNGSWVVNDYVYQALF